ncbi:hypothetical protein IWX46DRAFT_155584 [Phyllosticta citricarpa]|uniref:Transmembrane protein n=1 Tax=Phyllosticta citricarpa TaxID=55181 RepID=A0ABR1M6A5_9PEZI
MLSGSNAPVLERSRSSRRHRLFRHPPCTCVFILSFSSAYGRRFPFLCLCLFHQVGSTSFAHCSVPHPHEPRKEPPRMVCIWHTSGEIRGRLAARIDNVLTSSWSAPTYLPSFPATQRHWAVNVFYFSWIVSFLKLTRSSLIRMLLCFTKQTREREGKKR